MRSSRLNGMLAACMALAISAMPARGQDVPDANRIAPSEDPARSANGLSRRPPMGWNSWNRFACAVNEKVVRAAADAMVSSGMRDAGYSYVVIDDCWQGPRDAYGFITADTQRFPSGMKALADYVHSKGLKFGLYSDAGTKTCGGRPGSQGHEYQDAARYASWGTDYLKYDWCSSGSRNAEEAYALMADALRGTGRDILFSMCEWGQNRPWLWAAKIGNIWRTTGDITDQWDGRHGTRNGFMKIVDENEPLWPYAGPGHWNDPDMLEVGNGGMTNTEYRTHFSLWAMMVSPLIAGNDIASMSPATQSILLNAEVIAVDQDPLGVQGHRVWHNGASEIWSKPLSNGGRAILLVNRDQQPAIIAVEWPQLGYPNDLRLNARDLWEHKELGAQSRGTQALVPPHGSVMIVLHP